MNKQTSHDVFPTKKHLEEFAFEDSNFSSMLSATGQYRYLVLSEYASDVSMVRRASLITKGLSEGLIRRKNTENLVKIYFNPKEEHSLDHSRVKHTLVSHRANVDPVLKGLFIVHDNFVRIDHALALSYEWWVPKTSLVGLENAPKGFYQTTTDVVYNKSNFATAGLNTGF